MPIRADEAASTSTRMGAWAPEWYRWDMDVPLLRRVALVAVVACLLVSCSTAQAPVGDAHQGVARGSTASSLARRLDHAVRTLRDPNAPPDDVARAGWHQQLATRSLADAGPRLERAVLARVSRPTARLVRPEVRAARELRSLSSPQPRLPRWRIVAPPRPAELLRYYRAAGRRIGVPWAYLAAIHLVETRMGRIRGTSTAGARGPMQFLPATWAIYGAGGDINDARDSILAAARLLRANGAPRHMAGALRHYNNAPQYVHAVTAYARTMQRARWAYRGYWQWRVLYRTVRGTFLLPVGYPRVQPRRLPGT
jgi:membrane-bound lytic murein transglycosylase B